MLQQTAKAVANADIVLFLIDGKTGVLDEDAHFARCDARARECGGAAYCAQCV
jgi:predicted GTPase